MISFLNKASTCGAVFILVWQSAVGFQSAATTTNLFFRPLDSSFRHSLRSSTIPARYPATPNFALRSDEVVSTKTLDLPDIASSSFDGKDEIPSSYRKGAERQSSPLPEADDTSQTKRWILGLLWLTACLSALDRVAMSVAIVPMADEFGFDDSAKGSISSFLSFGYALSILPAGFVTSKLPPALIMLGGIGLWSAATLATPAAAASVGTIMMLPLLLARMLVGVGESIVLPTSTRILTEWTRPEEKSKALALIFSGFQAGTITALLLSPEILNKFDDWRPLFYIYGLGGLLLLIPWFALAQTSRAPLSANEEPQMGNKDTMTLSMIQEAPWGDFVRSKGAWAMLMAHSAKNWGSYLALAWTPTFFLEQYGLGVRESAWLSVLPCLAGVVGGFVAGTTADAVVQGMGDPSNVTERTRIRKIFQSIGLLVPALSLGLLAWDLPEEAWVAQLFITVNIGFQSFNAAGYDAANQEKAGPRWAGLLYSVTSLPAVLIGTGATYLTGRILDATDQDWSLVFGLNSLVYILGAVAFIILYDAEKEFD